MIRRVLILAFLFASFAFATPVPKTTDVVIIGAGLSGLAAGYQLKKVSIPFHILEITPRVGGRVRTIKYERRGETVYADSGMEEYWESNPAVQVLKELALPTRSDVAVSSLVLLGKLFALGDEDAESFRKRIFSEEERTAWAQFEKELGPLVKQTRSTEPLKPEVLKLKDISFAAWVGEKKLPPKISEWIRVSLECEIGTAWDRISAIDGIAEMHIFLGGGERAVRVLGGNEKFTEAFADAVGRSQISLNKAVRSVVTKGSTVTVSYLDTATHVASQIEAKHVISTVPLYRLFEIQFDPPLSEKKQQAIQTLGWGSYFKAHVFVDKKAEKYWLKEGVSMLPILSDSALGVIYDGNPDQKTRTRIVSLLVSGDAAERFNMAPQTSVREEIKREFEKLWPGFSQQIEEIEFHRYHPRAIAAWNVGRSRFDDLSAALREPEHQVYLAGDHTETSHSDGAFLSAERVVKQILTAPKKKVRRR